MNLKSWRYVMEPNIEVSQGRYKQAEFAADLAQVVRNEGRAEYTNPAEFFGRTYLTGGLKSLLVETLRRLTTGDGEPVIQLKTSFGGGKTHSLLALYHLFGGKIQPYQASAVEEILNAASISELPKVHTAVIVGTWENPLKSTLWGEIAVQLSRATGNPEIYELIRESDEKKISPGVPLLREIFDAAGSCLILIDELVAYGRKLRRGELKTGGTFGNLMSFIQELTEAAKASKQTAVVVSIPESDAEIIDNLGKEVLTTVEKYFGRVEFVWTPVTVVEAYEIVRRRLFQACRDERAREETCAAFFNMYLNNANDFPYESRQNAYKEKLLACYPIHPKFFDYLCDKWTSLEKFQKTRGVLRLMANVIHRLWSQGDSSALIMPGNIPLDYSPVRDELTKYLGGNWDAIVNSEIDGEKSKPRELDAENPRYGQLTAARKISRTIFLGTAAGNRAGDVRGIEENEIRLGVIQPQDAEDIAKFNDALTKLKNNLYYLYSQGTRLWFGVNPTLRKLVDDKREKYSDDDIYFEVEKRLRTWKGKELFKGVHICPKNSDDVAENQNARLVILSPKYAYTAKDAAKEILENRDKIPRRYRNTLIFLAPAADKMDVLKNAARDFMAWREVIKDTDSLNLDRVQINDAKSNLNSAEKTFAIKISQAYSQILAPENFDDDAPNSWDWWHEEIICTAEDNISVAAEKVIAGEILLKSLGSAALKRILDNFIWREKDSVELNELWEYFTKYYYMPRLNDKDVLIETIRKGVPNKIFGLADNENFDGLQFGDISVSQISLEKFLIKAEAAQKKIDELTPPQPPVEPVENDSKKNQPPKIIEPPKSPPLSTRFYMDTKLESSRYTSQIKKYMDEIISLLENEPDIDISIKFSVDISLPNGVPKEIQENILANCQMLKIDQFGFD